MKLGKHQRSKQGCQDLCWKIRNRAQSFVLRSCTMYELRNQHVSIGQFLSTEYTTIVFVHGQGQKREQKHKTN